MSQTKVPALSNSMAGLPPRLKTFLSAIAETLMVRAGSKGDSLDKDITYRDLIDAGIVSGKGHKGRGSIVNPAAVADNQAPAPLERFAVAGGAASLVVTWATVLRPGHGLVEVWRAYSPDMAGAEMVGTSLGQIYVDLAVTIGQEYWVTARAISASGIAGPWSDPLRAIPQAEVMETVQPMIDAGSVPVQGQPYLVVPPGGIEIDGVELEEGTYFLSLFIANGSIVRAQIAKATINSAHFKDLSATKIVFNAAQGRVLDSAVILGGLISGTRFEGSEMIGGTFNGTRITVGEGDVPAIDLRGSDGVVSINSPQKDMSRLDSFDAIEIAQGSISLVIYIPGYGQAKSQAMCRMESGIASSNEVVTLPGYWRDIPNIMVFPSEVLMPDPAADTGSRRLVCSATNVARLSEDDSSPDFHRIKFTATAKVPTSGTSRNVNVGSTLWDVAYTHLQTNGYGLLNGSKEAVFTVPQSAGSADIKTLVEIFEWVDLDGNVYFYAWGVVVLSFYISDDNGATWVLIGQSGGFNSNGSGIKQVNHSFVFAPSTSARLGKVVYSVGNGQVMNQAAFIPAIPVKARLYVRCDSVLYPVAAGENFLDGKLDWLAISR